MKNSLIKCSAPLPPVSADKIRTAMKDKKTADAVIKAFKNKNGGV